VIRQSAYEVIPLILTHKMNGGYTLKSLAIRSLIGALRFAMSRKKSSSFSPAGLKMEIVSEWYHEDRRVRLGLSELCEPV
jgi:hypothetical protein